MNSTPLREPVVWVMTDNRPGNVTQVLGVAEAIGLPFRIIPIQYNWVAQLPNFIRRRALLGITPESKKMLQPPWPDIIISAGRRIEPVVLHIKQQNLGKTFLIHLMKPALRSKDWDVMIIPSHDRPADDGRTISIMGCPHQLSDDKLTEAARLWLPTIHPLPSPRIGILMGGSGKAGSINAKMANELGQMVNDMARERGGSVLATTSRRTAPKAAEALEAALTVPKLFHHWGQGRDNPYRAILALSDVVVVTGDSISMISEACFTGKPVYIFHRPGMSPRKHIRLHHLLYASGYAKPLRLPLESFQPQRLLFANMIGQQLQKMLVDKGIAAAQQFNQTRSEVQ